MTDSLYTRLGGYDGIAMSVLVNWVLARLKGAK
jgi:hypothetical protein